MDKKKTRASECVWKMKGGLDKWVSLTVELADGLEFNQEKSEDIRMLARDYFDCKKAGTGLGQSQW